MSTHSPIAFPSCRPACTNTNTPGCWLAVSGCRWILGALVLLPGFGALTTSVRAQAFAQGTVNFYSLTIQSAAGTIEQYPKNWQLMTFAEAQNSEGEKNSDPRSWPRGFGSGTTNSDASVKWAEGHGKATGSENPPLGVGLADSIVDIPHLGFNGSSEDPWAESLGRSQLVNNFQINGGTGEVEVTFTIQYDLYQKLKTTGQGRSAKTETIFAFIVEGDRLCFDEQKNSIEANQEFSFYSVITKTVTKTLTYGKPIYWLVEVDSESYAKVPEATSVFGLGLFLGAVGLRSWRRSRALDFIARTETTVSS